MSRREWKLFLADMLEASGKINRYITGMNFEGFQADSRTVDAVVRNLEIIGEAAQSIPIEIKQLKPAIDWAAIKGLLIKSIIPGYVDNLLLARESILKQ